MVLAAVYLRLLGRTGTLTVAVTAVVPGTGRSRGAPGARRAAPSLRTAFLYLGMVVAIIVILAPFAWLLISSVALPVDLLERPLQWIPAHVTRSTASQT